MVKVTFAFDDATMNALTHASQLLGRAKSQVVRRAVQDFAARMGRLSEQERIRLLRVFDRVVPAIPQRPGHDVEKELKGLRAARRGGGRLRRTTSRRIARPV